MPTARAANHPEPHGPGDRASAYGAACVAKASATVATKHVCANVANQVTAYRYLERKEECFGGESKKGSQKSNVSMRQICVDEIAIKEYHASLETATICSLSMPPETCKSFGCAQVGAQRLKFDGVLAWNHREHGRNLKKLQETHHMAQSYTIMTIDNQTPNPKRTLCHSLFHRCDFPLQGAWELGTLAQLDTILLLHATKAGIHRGV